MYQTQGSSQIQQQVPFEFICPISHQIMEDPVINKDSINFDRKWIEKWILRQERDPFSRKPLKKEDLIPNKALKNLIQSFKKRRQNVRPLKKSLQIEKTFDYKVVGSRNQSNKIYQNDQKTIQSLQRIKIDKNGNNKNIKQQLLNEDKKCQCQIM